jgi:GntR family transcriptional regulator, transcriptional repressor for pyruvate dehydrogenase complex
LSRSSVRAGGRTGPDRPTGQGRGWRHRGAGLPGGGIRLKYSNPLETVAAKLAATRATPAELRTIEVAMQQCRHGYVHGEVGVFNQANDDFHAAVAVASHNTFLGSAVREARQLQRQSSAIVHDTIDEGTAVEEHEAIYRAIRDGRHEDAAAATAVYLDRTLEDDRREIQRRLFG